jgi:hypothetical protein
VFLQVLFCIKHLDPMQYEHITGLHQSGALAFAAELKERGIPFWLRYVLIPNLTDRVGDIEMLIAFAKAQPTMLVSGESLCPMALLAVDSDSVVARDMLYSTRCLICRPSQCGCCKLAWVFQQTTTGVLCEQHQQMTEGEAWYWLLRRAMPQHVMVRVA